MKTSKSAKSVSPALVLTLQERVLTAIRDAARAAKCDVMEASRPWSNVGVWHFQKPDMFNAIAAMRFDFQDGSFSLDLKPGVPSQWMFAGGVRIEHHAIATGLPKFLASLTQMLTPASARIERISNTLADLTVTFTHAQRALIIESVNSFGSGQHPIATEANVLHFSIDYVRQCVRDAREHVGEKGLRLIDAIEDRLGFTK